jgi:hypothetical protein
MVELLHSDFEGHNGYFATAPFPALISNWEYLTREWETRAVGYFFRARSRIKFVIHFMYIDCTYILVKKFKTTHRQLMSS